jgi:hypothetical protein
MKTIDILSTKKVSEIYREKISLAINKDFFSALGTFNPPLQKIASGYRLFLKSGEQVDVPDSFQVEVYEAASFKGEF